MAVEGVWLLIAIASGAVALRLRLCSEVERNEYETSSCNVLLTNLLW